jgi:serine/threonine-protein kinase RsbW
MNTLSRRLDSKLESVDDAETAALEVARQAGFPDFAQARIGFAVREIMTNAVVHGNRCDQRKKVFLNISRTPERLEITISDQGDGFDPNRLPDPLSPGALLRGCGRGVYLARTFMDEFHVRRGDVCGTAIGLVKYIRDRQDR